MIHVAYKLWSGDGFFAKSLGTSMLSMFENTKEKVTVHIMHNSRLTSENHDIFSQIADKYNQRVEFHNVEEIAGSTLRKFEAAYPIPSGINAAWYSSVTSEVFPYLDKIIFLGADTLFNLDVAELWAYDLDKSGYGIGAVPEAENKSPKQWLSMVQNNLVEYEDYFNVDVMLLKPKFFRENFDAILNACKFVYQNGYRYFEQDALNYLFSKKYLKLPGKFNITLIRMRAFTPKPHHLEDGIYQFSAPERVSLNTDDVFNKLYFEYFLKTPWATADMFGNINKALDKMFRHYHNESKNNLLRLTNLISKRRRAFFIEDRFLEPAKQIFEIKDDELVMNLSTDPNSLAEKLNALRGKVILFILIKDYPQLLDFLRNQNFVENTDFVNALAFLSERHGFKFNFDTQGLVQEL